MLQFLKNNQLLEKGDTQTNIYFFRDVFRLMGGTVLSLAISLLSAPIITRLYGPEPYGILALFTSFVGIIGVIICLRYELAIMLPKKDEEAANVLALCLFFVIFISALTIPIFFFWKPVILNLINSSKMSLFTWLATPSLFIGGLFLSFSYWISRKKQFGHLSIARITNSFVTASIQLIVGFAGYATGYSLIIASLMGSSASVVVLGIRIFKYDKEFICKNINKDGITLAFKRYKRFPIYDTWSGLFNSASWQLPVIVLSAFFSPTIVGYYALGMSLLQMPMTVIGSAIGQVFFQRAAIAGSDIENSLASIVENTIITLSKIGLLPFLLLTLVGEQIFTILFGQIWAEAGIYAQILALWMFFVFITSPISTIFSVMEKQRTFLLVNIILMVTRIGSIILGGLLGDIYISLILFTLTGILDYAGINYWILRKTKVPIKRVLKNLVAIFLLCSPFMIAIILAKWFLLLDPGELVLMSIFAALSYYAIIIRTDKALNIILISLMKSHL